MLAASNLPTIHRIPYFLTKLFVRPKSHYTAPACGFQIAKIFQLGFFTNDSARPRHNWGFTASRELKKVKRISAFSV
jgi:hypothetical protein